MKKTIIKLICLFLILVSVGLLFLPCWTVDDKSISPAAYIYRPSEYRSLTTALRSVMNSKKLATRIGMPVFILLAGSIVLLATGAIKCRTAAPAVCCLFTGLLGVIICLLSPILRCGTLWGVRLALYSLMLVLGAAAAAITRQTGRKAQTAVPGGQGGKL